MAATAQKLLSHRMADEKGLLGFKTHSRGNSDGTKPAKFDDSWRLFLCIVRKGRRDDAECQGRNDTKLPAVLADRGAHARSQYARSEVHYLEGSLDSSNAPGTFYGIIDKSCAASAQGPFRLQRGLAYAAYDRDMLSKNPQRTVTIVPGCAHDVACVFPNETARSALFGARP